MLKKVAVGAGVVAVVVGSASAALASGSSSSSPTASQSSVSSAPSASSAATSSTSSTARPGSTAQGARHHRRDALRRAVQAQWVTVDKSGKSVTHDAIRGMVTAVSASSVTVEGKDSVTETFAVTAATKVRLRASGKPVNASLAQVKVGDRAVVIGTGTSSLTAKRVVDRGAAKTKAAASS